MFNKSKNVPHGGAVMPGNGGGPVQYMDDDGDRSYASSNKMNKKKKKKGHKGVGVEEYDNAKRRKSIKKMRMRLWGRGRKPRRKKVRRDESGGDDPNYPNSTTSPPNVPGPMGGGFPNGGLPNGGSSIMSLDATTKDIAYYGGSGRPAFDGSSVNFQTMDNSTTVGGTSVSSSLIQTTRPQSNDSASQSKRLEAATPEDINKKFRVKPFYAFPAPSYMNEVELYQCMMSPSTEFNFLTSYLNPSTKATRRAKVPEIVRRHFGSPKEDGRIGSLRVEVLGCVGLDRLKPDVSVFAVCGDCAFSTDIIQGSRSPMFPNSSKRAAVFPLHHAYARLFIGVFDVKQRKNSEADHFCGRVALDIPQLRPDTEYDVSFPLRVSSFIYDRQPRGVVRVRFSLHWFSERAAILSYLKRPRNPLAFSKQAKKQPTIPCGDPKTFRNVAVTVHGQDFPGKYTRGAFRATMREFNLSQQNIRFLLKVLILDCILYENPLMSLYLFVTGMYCVYQNSVRLVPPFFVGWLIYLFVENQIYFNGNDTGHLGYKALTIKEVFYGLVRDGKNRKSYFDPILVQKRPRKQILSEDGKMIDVELQNHREFPFAERFEYPKFTAAEAIAPSFSTQKKKKGKEKGMAVPAAGDSRTARRLSIYVTPVNGQEPAQEEDDNEDESDDDESQEDDGENDGEGMDEEDEGYDENMDDSDDDSDDDKDEKARKKKKKGRIFEAGQASKTRRIRVGPQQNTQAKSGRKIPPQAHLSKVEHMLHKASKNISIEHVHFPPPHLQSQLGKEVNIKGPAGDILTAKEKQYFDEFDKLLGFRTKNPNPIVRITSSFLGPLMRIIRIVIYGVRISFNICTWRDPYLTFWVFAFLCTLAFILLIFPWRTFFFLSTLFLLGPQNIAVRKYLERRAKERESEEKEEKAKEEIDAQPKIDDLNSKDSGPNASRKAKEKEEKDKADAGKKKRRWGRGRKKDEEAEQDEINEAELYHSPRPAFYAHTRPTKRTQVPRDVAVPYFRFRKDRFFDWPPDPTVSRATPMLTHGVGVDDDHDDRRGGFTGGFGGDFDDGYDDDQGGRVGDFDGGAGGGRPTAFGHQYGSINDPRGLRQRARGRA